MKASSFALQGFPGSPGNVGPAGKEGPMVSIVPFPLYFQGHLLHPYQVYFVAYLYKNMLEINISHVHHLGTQNNGLQLRSPNEYRTEKREGKRKKHDREHWRG